MVQKQHVSYPLQKGELVKLMQDIVQLLESPEHGKAFTLTLIAPDCYNPIRISIPVAPEQEASVLVTFAAYPSSINPAIEPRGGALSEVVASRVKSHLQGSTKCSSRFVRLPDMVALVQEAVSALGHEEDKVASEASAPLANKQSKLPAITRTLLAVRSTAIPIASAMLMPVLASAMIAVARWSLTIGFSLAITAFVLTALLAMRSRSSSPVLPETRTTMEQTSPPEPQEDTAAIPVAQPEQETVEENQLFSGVIQVFLLEPLVERILGDFSRYAPDEYAFLCSGVVTPEGTALVTGYYPGDMLISTPVYCELTEAFIRQTLYRDIPEEHNLVVWGHVHPASGPSHTDAVSFDHLASCDREIAEQGVIAVRSIAMLINTYTQRISFYDVHTHEQIAHVLLPVGGMQKL